jgi:HEAT repeat protein
MVYKTADEIVELLADPTVDDHHKGALFSILVSRMETAFGGSKADLMKLYELLHESFRKMLAESEDTVLKAVIDNDSKGDVNLKRAFVLGQLEMASHFIAHVTNHRAEDDFIPKLTSEPLVTFAKVLRNVEYYEGRTRAQIVEETGKTEEEVRKAMRELIDMGAADFRKGGDKAEYFLTHTGKAVVGPD